MRPFKNTLISTKIRALILFSAAIFSLFLALIIPKIEYIRSIPDGLIFTSSELDGFSGGVVSCEVKKGGGKDEVSFSICGIPVKKVSGQVVNARKAVAGGCPVGLSVKSDGVIVTALNAVDTDYGKARVKSEINKGDIITEFNGKKIVYIDDLTNALACYGAADKQAELKVLRGGREKHITAYPAKEEYTERYRLGLNVKDYAEGVGTLTYCKENGEFGALGHPINSQGGTVVIPCHGGSVYACKVIGQTKGIKGRPGELRGLFINTASPLGTVKTNNYFGVYGSFFNPVEGEAMALGGRLSVRPGKAQIITTIGDKPEKFNIEIIKAMPQSSPSEKGMVLKVTDKRLLAATGGIVQGMSGSPIIQGGKIVGAVTHVFIDDPAKGYGVYIDWMFK
jgi:stage IV sporulation protein B